MARDPEPASVEVAEDPSFLREEEERLLVRSRWAFGALAIIFPLFHGLDHLVLADTAWAALSLRLAASSACLAGLALSFTSLGRRVLLPLSVGIMLSAVATLAGLVVVHGETGYGSGHVSPVALVLAVCFMFPWRTRVALAFGAASAMLYGAVVFASVDDPTVFFVPMAVMAAVALVGPLVTTLDRRARRSASLARMRLAEARREADERQATASRLEEAERSVVDRELRMATIGRRTSEIAHDLRNLLSLITMYGDLARHAAEARGDHEQLADIETMVGAAQRAARSMQDVVDYARGAKGAMRTSTDLAALVDEVVSLLRPRVEHLGATVEVILPSERTLLTLMVDRGQILRAVENLLHNALDALYAREPPRVVRVTLSRQGSEAVVEVTDNGAGFDDNVKAELFQPFIAGRPGGSGLGLATVRHLVEFHGGTVSADGHGPLGGARFVIRLPES